MRAFIHTYACMFAFTCTRTMPPYTHTHRFRNIHLSTSSPRLPLQRTMLANATYDFEIHTVERRRRPMASTLRQQMSRAVANAHVANLPFRYFPSAIGFEIQVRSGREVSSQYPQHPAGRPCNLPTASKLSMYVATVVALSPVTHSSSLEHANLPSAPWSVRKRRLLRPARTCGRVTSTRRQLGGFTTRRWPISTALQPRLERGSTRTSVRRSTQAAQRETPRSGRCILIGTPGTPTNAEPQLPQNRIRTIHSSRRELETLSPI